MLLHSVRGSQYASGAFWEVIKECGITSSMSRRGNCRGQAKDETMAWLLWCNKARLHSTLAYVSPMQFESEWLARQADS